MGIDLNIYSHGLYVMGQMIEVIEYRIKDRGYKSGVIGYGLGVMGHGSWVMDYDSWVISFLFMIS